MITTGQIFLRLFLSLIFGIIISIFNKKEKSLSFKIYPLVCLVSASTAIFILEILIKVYSKIEITLLPAILILGVFIFSQTVLRLNEKLDETIFYLFNVILTMVIGFSLGMGFYQAAIFVMVLSLIFFIFSPIIESLTKKLWRK